MIQRSFFSYFGLLYALVSCTGNSSSQPYTDSIDAHQSMQKFTIAMNLKQQTSPSHAKIPEAKLPASATFDLGDITEWTTDIHISTKCESSPEIFTVTKGHGGPADCEALFAFAAMDNHGDYFDSGGHLAWASSDPDIVTVECTQASHGRVCWLTGYKDLFDAPNSLEPSSTIQVCSHNACPPQPSDPVCKKDICTEFEVTSILSIEGQWMVMHDFGKEDFTFAPEQDGRHFKAEWSSVRNGLVSESSVRFEQNEILYKGFVLPDRKTMYGSAWDATTMNFLGSWVAQNNLFLTRPFALGRWTGFCFGLPYGLNLFTLARITMRV